MRFPMDNPIHGRRMLLTWPWAGAGDQAVVKAGDKISYYGGKTKQVEKGTRVKARVKAHGPETDYSRKRPGDHYGA